MSTFSSRVQMNTLSMLAPNPDVTKRMSNNDYDVSSLGVSPDVNLCHVAGFNISAKDIHHGFSLTRTRHTVLSSLQNLFKLHKHSGKKSVSDRNECGKAKRNQE